LERQRSAATRQVWARLFGWRLGEDVQRRFPPGSHRPRLARMGRATLTRSRQHLCAAVVYSYAGQTSRSAPCPIRAGSLTETRRPSLAGPPIRTNPMDPRARSDVQSQTVGRGPSVVARSRASHRPSGSQRRTDALRLTAGRGQSAARKLSGSPGWVAGLPRDATGPGTTGRSGRAVAVFSLWPVL
jgi:hypothetical protein